MAELPRLLTDKALAGMGVGIAHHFGGKVYLKETFIPAKGSLAQHAHDHDHLSYLVSGEVSVTINGEVFPVRGPACMLIKAGRTHEVYAQTAAVWLCLWGTDCEDPEKVDAAVVNGE